MGRPFTAADRARAAAQEFAVYARLEVQDSDGVYQDVSVIGGIDWFNSATISDSIDQSAAAASIQLQREVAVIAPEVGLFAHWTLDGVATDSAGTNNGTLNNFSRTNSIIQSRDLSITWARTGTGTSVLNAVGITGAANTASTLSDTDATQTTTWHEDVTVPVDTNTHAVSFWIKKDADITRFPLFSIGISGGTSVARATCVNTSTGAIVANNIIGTSTQRIIDGALVGYAGYWILELTITNNGTAGNTILGVSILAAYGNVINVANVATTGSVVIGQVQAELNALVFTFPAIITTTATVTVTLTAAASPVVGSAVSFDGSNDHISVPDVQGLKWTGQDFSAFGWANRSQDDTTAGYIFSKPWNASGQYNWQLLINASGQISVILLGGTSFTLTSAGTLPAGAFHHVGFTVEQATKIVRIYLDGVIIATSTHTITGWTPSLGDANQALTLGSLYPYGANWAGVLDQAFRGFLDDLRVYSDALSPGEVVQLYMYRGTKSLAPFVTASTVNRNAAGAYSPMLDLGRKFRVSAAITAAADINAIKITASDAWDQQVYSKAGYTGGAYTRAVTSAPQNEVMLALNSDPLTDASFASLDYAFNITGGTNLVAIYESGTQVFVSGAGGWKEGDVFEIIYDNATIKYYQNGTLLRSVATTAGRTFFLDTSFYGGTGSVTYGIAKLNGLRFGPNAQSCSIHMADLVASAGVSLTENVNPLVPGPAYDPDTPKGTWSSSGVTLASTAAAINDGNILLAAFHTDTAVPGAYVQIDNGGPVFFDSVRVYNASNGLAIFKVRGSADASSWTDVATGFNPNKPGWNMLRFIGATFRYWRLELTNTPGVSTWYYEVQFSGDWKELIQGTIDSIDWGGKGNSVVTISGRDISAKILDTYIDTRRSYGSGGGTAMETVIAQLLTDNIPSGTPTLTTPVSPSFLIRTFVQDYGSLYDALTEVAAQAGFVVRYRYDSSGNLALVLFKPDRTLANGVTFSIGPEEYLDIPGLKISLQDIRTWIELRYIDSTTGALTLVKSPVSGTSAAITKYGKRYMAIDEQNGSQINTTSQAQAMVDAVCNDLQEPFVEHILESFLLWWVQLTDYVQFNQNTLLYDTAQNGAITSYTHTIQGGTAKTSIATRGKPSGLYKTWLSYAKALGGEYIAPHIGPPTGQFQIGSEDGAFGYINFVFDDPQGNVANYRITTISGRAAAVTGAPTTPTVGGSNAALVALVDKVASYIDVDWYGVDSDGTSGALLGHMRFTFGLGARPVPPDLAYATSPSSTFPNGGILTASASIDNDTTNVRCVASKTGKPSDSDVNAAAPVAVGVGSTSVNLGTLLSGLNTGERYWIRARSYNAVGLESDVTDVTDVYVAGSTNATATVSLTATNPSASNITFVVKPNSHCAEFEVFVKEYDGGGTDPGTAVAIDAGYPTPLDAVVVGADATRYRAQPNTDYSIVIPIAAGTNWILITVVPYDAIARQGTKLNAKGRGNGTTAPLPPISATADAAPTATSITNKVTLATPRADRVKMYRDNVAFGGLVDVSASANGALVTLPADTGLTPNTTYSYTYSGVDSATGIESVGRTSPINVATAAAATIPTPTLASAAYNAATETWSFTVTPGASSPAGVTWKIERSTVSGSGYADRTATFSTSTSLSESDPMDTTTGTDYYFKVYGSLAGWTDSAHSAFVGPIHKTGTGEPASAPTIGSITNPISHQVAVSWTNTDTIDGVYIEVERLLSGVWAVAGSRSVAAGSTASGNIGVTTVGIPYRGRARYYNAARNGAWSAYTSQITIT